LTWKQPRGRIVMLEMNIAFPSRSIRFSPRQLALAW